MLAASSIQAKVLARLVRADAVDGDTYTVVGSGPGGAITNFIDIMGITFDSTPEPTTLVGCAAASLAVIWLSRRRKKHSLPGCF